MTARSLIAPFAGQEERELAAAVAAYARDLGPRIEAAESEGAIPGEVIAELGRLGVLGMTVPEADGGLGASSVAFALVLEELAAAWASLAGGVAVNGGIVAGSIVRLGTAEQRRRWLPRLMDGSGLAAFALTEPSSGSDAAALRSTAVRDGDEWALNGRKLFVTNLRYAPFVIVLARVGESDLNERGSGSHPADPSGSAGTPGTAGPSESASPEHLRGRRPTQQEQDPRRPHAGITAFVVPTDAPGVSIGRPERKMGLLASDTSALALDDVRLGPDAVLGEVGQGFGSVAMAGLDGGRIGIAAQAVGIARGALERAQAYALERRQFGRPIASFQALRFALAQARTEVEAARLLTLRAAWRKDRGLPFTRDAAQAKLYASEMAQRVTHAAVQTLGGYGYLREYAVERYARDARATTIYEGTSEVQRLVIARHLVAV